MSRYPYPPRLPNLKEVAAAAVLAVMALAAMALALPGWWSLLFAVPATMLLARNLRPMTYWSRNGDRLKAMHRINFVIHRMIPQVNHHTPDRTCFRLYHLARKNRTRRDGFTVWHLLFQVDGANNHDADADTDGVLHCVLYLIECGEKRVTRHVLAFDLTDEQQRETGLVTVELLERVVDSRTGTTEANLGLLDLDAAEIEHLTAKIMTSELRGPQ